MDMKKAGIAELKNHLSDYIKDVEKGSSIAVLKRNKTIARISPLPSVMKNATVLGEGRGNCRIHCDLTQPCVPEDDWEVNRN